MRYLAHIWLIVMALAGFLASCHHAPHYDSRLTLADSLMVLDPPDSALTLLSSIAPGTLASDGDRAYHALLTTQARYKCYAVITSDAEINSAIAYYEHHNNEQEKLTRAYIYKGAVMEELENLVKPDSAMIYYKRADLNASANNDYFNKGYALLRIGKLYYNHHAYDGRDIEKLEQALDCFRKAGNIHYQIVCLKDLGAMYRGSNKDKAEKTLNEAISLAEREKDTTNLIHSLNSLAYLYFMKGDRASNVKARKLLQRIKSLRFNGLNDNIYSTFACVYASLGLPDSAMTYLQTALENGNDSLIRRKNTYLEAMSRIALARGDSLNYLKLSNDCDRITFSQLNDPDIVNIMYAEQSFDNDRRHQEERDRWTRNFIIACIVGAIILGLIAIAVLPYRRTHRYDKLVVELQDQSQNQLKDLASLQNNINELKINDERLKGFISSHMNMMRDMIEACYHGPSTRVSEDMKRIVKFQDSNRDNWFKFYDYIDLEYNGIMTRTREQYPQLNERELLLLALTCMGYSYIQTAIIMGYSNATSVSVIKQRLAKKMGLDCSLNEYIERNTGKNQHLTENRQ